MPSNLVAKTPTIIPKANASSQPQEPQRENESTYSLLQANAKNYEEMSMIGNGAYGTVYKAKDLANNGEFVALKKVRIPLVEEGVPINMLREISLLKQLTSFEHPNVVRLLDICHGKRLEEEHQMIIYLVFEHVDQDLATYLERCPSPGLGPDLIKDLTFQMLHGLDFLHSNRVLHRDLKPQNILISNGGQLKLADFGLARVYSNQMTLTSVVVTLWYRSPEVILQRAYATAVDVWSCGCILAELYRRKPLFNGENELDQLSKILEIIGSPTQSEWPIDVFVPWQSFRYYKGVPIKDVVPGICSEGADLIKEMLSFDPNKRICCSTALKHPYFRDFELKCQYNFSHKKQAIFYNRHSKCKIDDFYNV